MVFSIKDTSGGGFWDVLLWTYWSHFHYSSIQLNIQAQTVEKIPSGFSENGVYDDTYWGAPMGYHSITVHYLDGTEATYSITGARDNIQTVDAPGYLTYDPSRTYSETGAPYGAVTFYYYYYTEAGVATPESHGIEFLGSPKPGYDYI